MALYWQAVQASVIGDKQQSTPIVLTAADAAGILAVLAANYPAAFSVGFDSTNNIFFQTVKVP